MELTQKTCLPHLSDLRVPCISFLMTNFLSPPMNCPTLIVTTRPKSSVEVEIVARHGNELNELEDSDDKARQGKAREEQKAF